MRYAKHLLIFAILLMIPTAALAQNRFEVSPYVGWRHGNDITDVSGVAINLDSGVAYGFMVDVGITSNLYAEFIFSYRDTGGQVFIPDNLPEVGPVGRFDVEGKVNYYQGGLLYQWDLANPMFKPFIVGTLGAANMSSDSAGESFSNTQFSWSGGGGIKVMFSKNVGLRGEYRLFGTSTNFVGRGGWCDWWGFCYTFLTNRYLYQSMFAVALTVVF
jgi:opacity protein-like surface antigen